MPSDLAASVVHHTRAVRHQQWQLSSARLSQSEATASSLITMHYLEKLTQLTKALNTYSARTLSALAVHGKLHRP